ncbi:MAG: zf-TFIIB domain-containing protein [Pirellulales bacterium]|nr:zf-TFIIB domain-containing protein [Pirellulales bacterium]
MKCPACAHELRPMEAGSVVVDVCEGGCGGIWFDHFELRKFDEPHEAEGEALLDVARDPSVFVDYSVRRTCPVCDGVVMMRHPFSPQDNVIVDECPGCGGIWLDAGELAAIRTNFSSDEQRAEAAKAWLTKTLDAHLTRARREDRQNQADTEKIAHLLRFLCPSYWIPGKQDWAAY